MMRLGFLVIAEHGAFSSREGERGSILVETRIIIISAVSKRNHSIDAHATSALMCLDRYIRDDVYTLHGIYILDHCRTKPPRDPESAGNGRAVGGRHRVAAATAAALGIQTPPRVA